MTVPDPKDWKAVQADWTHVQTFGATGKLACLNDQQRQALLTFMQVAYWPTRWQNVPDADTLNAFVSGLEESLMTDCDYMFSLRQTGCTIELLVAGVVVSSVQLDAEECGLLNAGGEGTKVIAPGATESDKKTALFSGAMALVIYAQEAILDAFNALEIEIELGKAATLWMETVPGLDLSPAYEVLVACDAFNEMLESVFETTDTPEWREEMSCKIMCWCVENNYTFDATIVYKWREYLTDMGISAPDYFYSNFVDLATPKALIDRFSLGMNDEDEDWITLCEDCMEFFGQVTFDDESDLDYTLTYGTVELIGNPGNGLQGEDWREHIWDEGKMARMRVDLGEDVHVKGVHFDWNFKNFVGGECSRDIRLLNSAEELLDSWHILQDDPQDMWHTEQQSFDEENVRYVDVWIEQVYDYTGPAWVYIDNVKIFEPEP